MAAQPWMDSASLNRRTLFKASLGVGFCAAIEPVWAQVITTPAEGLNATEVKIPAGDFSIPGYRAMPNGGGAFPLVVVIHEIFGVHEHIKDVCRRWAKLGYYAIAPDLFARQGDASAETDMAKLMNGIVKKTPDAQVAADLEATFAFAKANGSAISERAAITGYCWGGRQTWLYAERHPELKAGVAWYGPLAYAKSDLQPANPPDLAGGLKVPVLGLYGGVDKGIPKEQIQAFEAKLAAGESGSKIIVYDDAGHAFFADYRPSYVKADAEASWKAATAWLKAHGV
jgi:carboxymethylenebutenolidase